MRLRVRMDDFQQETGTRAGILLTMITTYGLRQNEHSGGVNAEVRMNDLFS